MLQLFEVGLAEPDSLNPFDDPMSGRPGGSGATGSLGVDVSFHEERRLSGLATG